MHGEVGPTRLSRRQVVAAGLAAAAAGAASLGRDPRTVAWAARRSAEPLAAGGGFEQGVAAGQPNLRGITLWTRVDGLERSSRLELEIARDPGFANVVERRRVRAAAIRDFAVKERVLTRRLSPGEQYYYRFATRTGSSPVGRFRTARPPDSREPVRIGFFSCQKWPDGFYTAHRGLAQEEDLDLVICLGDYIYESRQASQPIEGRQDTTGPNGDAEVQTLDEFRAKYRLYKSDPDLQAMHAAHAFQPIWDDHEAENNYAGQTEGSGVRGKRRVPFEERKRAGYLSFFEFHPIERVRSERNRIYRKLSLGASADLFMLDERQYRSPLVCDSATPCPQANDAPPGQTLLGAEQLEWLKAGLERSDATWKVLANQVMMMSLDLPPGVPLNADQWDGYAAERRELMEHVVGRGVGNVTVLTGDIHTYFAGTVTTTGRFEGRPAATEFVGGSITSEGLPEDFADDEAGRRRVALLSERIQQLNPHIVYNDQVERGYGVLEARPGELRVDFRAPETVKSPTSAMRTLASFRVASGSARVERL